MQLSVAPGLLVAFLLALVRASAWLAFAPPFNTRQIPATVKVGLAAALAISVAPQLAPATAASASQLPVSTPDFMGSVVLQALTGLALGFISNVLFQAVASAGALIDLSGGFVLSAAYDPLNQSTDAVIGRTYNLLAVTLLFAVNAHLLLIKGFITSFRAVPLDGASLAHLSSTVVGDVGVFFLSALEIAAPLLAVLFLTDVGLGLLTRAAPQLNVFSLGVSVKVLLTMLLVGTALPLLPGAVTELVDRGIRDGLGLLGVGG